MLLINANGLKNHVNELKTVLFDKRIDIALISETHFTKYSHISIPGYLLKSNHPDGNTHGGAAILIKTNLKFHPLTKITSNPVPSQSHLITFLLLLQKSIVLLSTV
jgi:exonuclease III